MNVLKRSIDQAAPVVQREVYLDARVPDVWFALVDVAEFGLWFCTKLDAPFRVGEVTHGYSTYPGCDHFRWRAVTETLDHERLLAYTWWPAPIDGVFNECEQSGTLVEFAIRATVDGTRVTIRESGFENLIGSDSLGELVRVREQGWRMQAENLRRHFRDSRTH